MKTMKEYETLKIYGSVLNYWKVEDENGYEHTTQMEVAYREYDYNGKLINVGSEDFTPRRYNEQTHDYRVYGWDGETRNAGKQRWFRELAWARINRNEVYKLRRFAEVHYGKGQAVLEVRAV